MDREEREGRRSLREGEVSRNPAENESCCRACAMQSGEVGFQWLLYFILATVDEIGK